MYSTIYYSCSEVCRKDLLGCLRVRVTRLFTRREAIETFVASNNFSHNPGFCLFLLFSPASAWLHLCASSGQSITAVSVIQVYKVRAWKRMYCSSSNTSTCSGKTGKNRVKEHKNSNLHKHHSLHTQWINSSIDDLF